MEARSTSGKRCKTGWAFDYQSNVSGETTGDRWLLAYGFDGYDKDTDLVWSWHNDRFTVFEILAIAARGQGRRLKKGWVVT